PQAARVLDDLFARALAKQASDRFPTAEAMGEAFRGALGLPASSTWAAQREMSALARPGGSTVRLEQVRAALVQGYRTAMLQQAP
ncbi:MAG TPA: hypothetical protein PK141_01335, partial [Polyangiaceae bacterium]|nr:hypothetical protein [Polyangiaceae bacterium]